MEEEKNLFDEMTNIPEQKPNTNNDVSVADAVQELEKEEVVVDSVFDYNKLPSTTGSSYNRVNLDNEEVVISKAEIKLPHPNSDWVEGRTNKNIHYKGYQFIVSYDTENDDHENYSGMRGFQKTNGSLGEPTIYTKKLSTQASKLFGKFKEYIIRTVKVEEKEMTSDIFEASYGLKQFMAFLNSKPKALLRVIEVDYDGKITEKNMISKFL